MQVGLVNSERNLNFFTRWYKYLVQILPAVVIGPQYFAGKVPLGPPLFNPLSYYCICPFATTL